MLQTLLITAALLSSAIDVEVQTLDGQKTAGRLTQLDSKQVAIESPAGAITIETGKLASVTRKVENPIPTAKPEVIVELIDDTRLHAKKLTTTKGQAEIELVSGSTIKLSTKAIRFARFAGGPTPSQVAEQWEEILALKATGDLIVMRSKGALDYTEGLLSDIDLDRINFKLDDEIVRVSRSKVEAILYYRAVEPEVRDPACMLHLRDGSQLAAGSIELNGEKIAVTTTGSASVELPVESLARLDYSIGRVQLLSDLDPELSEVTPYVGGPPELASFGSALSPRRDKNLENGPLKLAGTTYDNGLALHSQTRQVYRLAGKYRQLTAVAGIDDSIASGGNVLVQISGDGRPLWEGTIKRGDDPHALQIDVTGVKRLELVVGYGEDLDIGDHLNLCDVKLLK